MARIQSQQGDHDAASRTVQAFRATGPAADQDRQALLLLGTSKFGLRDLGGARAAFEQYLKEAGPAWPYAQIYLSQIDAQEIKLDSAVNRINQALAAGLPPETSYNAQVSLAGLEVQRKNSTEAIAAYRTAADGAPTATEAAEALWLLADAAQSFGDSAASKDALEQLIEGYPVTQRALDALADQRVASDSRITDLQRGTVYLNHQVNDKAVAAFQSIIDAGGDDAPQAQYNLGILSERAEDWQGAIDHYDAAINGLAPGANDSLRAQASWDKATVFERIGQTSDAIDAYAAVADYFDCRGPRAGGPVPRRLPGLPARAPGGLAGLLAALPDYRLAPARTYRGRTTGCRRLPTRSATRIPRPLTFRPRLTTTRSTTTACARRLALQARRRCRTTQRSPNRRQIGPLTKRGSPVGLALRKSPTRPLSSQASLGCGPSSYSRQASRTARTSSGVPFSSTAPPAPGLCTA